MVINDSPGFVAQRVVAMIVNIGCGVAQRAIATPADIDKGTKLGLGYPFGPLEWGDRLGAGRVLHILQRLQAFYGEPRYRPNPWLKRRVALGLPLSAQAPAVRLSWVRRQDRVPEASHDALFSGSLCSGRDDVELCSSAAAMISSMIGMIGGNALEGRPATRHRDTPANCSRPWAWQTSAPPGLRIPQPPSTSVQSTARPGSSRRRLSRRKGRRWFHILKRCLPQGRHFFSSLRGCS